MYLKQKEVFIKHIYQQLKMRNIVFILKINILFLLLIEKFLRIKFLKHYIKGKNFLRIFLEFYEFSLIFCRLRMAIQHKEDFKVIIVIPVHPAGDPKESTTRYVQKYNYESIR